MNRELDGLEILSGTAQTHTHPALAGAMQNDHHTTSTHKRVRLQAQDCNSKNIDIDIAEGDSDAQMTPWRDSTPNTSAHLDGSTISIDGVIQKFPPRGRITLARLQHRFIMTDQNIIQPVQRFNYIELKPAVAYSTKVYVPREEKELGINLSILERLARTSNAKVFSGMAGMIGSGFDDDYATDSEDNRIDFDKVKRISVNASTDEILESLVQESTNTPAKSGLPPNRRHGSVSPITLPRSPVLSQADESGVIASHLDSIDKANDPDIARHLSPSDSMIIQPTNSPRWTAGASLEQAQVNSPTLQSHREKAAVSSEKGDTITVSSPVQKNHSHPIKMIKLVSKESPVASDFLYIRSKEERYKGMMCAHNEIQALHKATKSTQYQSKNLRTSICSICFGSDLPLVSCHGHCNRLFHLRCLKETTEEPPLVDALNIPPSSDIANIHTSLNTEESAIPSEQILTNKSDTTESAQTTAAESTTAVSNTQVPIAVDYQSDDSSNESCFGLETEDPVNQHQDSLDHWTCKECKDGVHMCNFCGNHGTDLGEVFQCSESGCDVFSHILCTQDAFLVGYSLKPNLALSGSKHIYPGSTSSAFQFKCPCHLCHRCLLPGNRNQLLSCAVCLSTYHFGCLPMGYQYFSENSIICKKCIENQNMREDGIFRPDGKTPVIRKQTKRVTPESFPASQAIFSASVFRQELFAQETFLCHVYLFLKEKPTGPHNIHTSIYSNVDITSTVDANYLVQLSLVDMAVLEVRPCSTDDLVPFMAIKEELTLKAKVILVPTGGGYSIVIQPKPFRKIPSTLPLYRHNHVMFGKIVRKRGDL